MYIILLFLKYEEIVIDLVSVRMIFFFFFLRFVFSFLFVKRRSELYTKV